MTTITVNSISYVRVLSGPDGGSEAPDAAALADAEGLTLKPFPPRENPLDKGGSTETNPEPEPEALT